MKRIFIIFLGLFISLFIFGCESTINNNTTNTTTNTTANTTTTTMTTEESELSQALHNIYDLAIEADAFSGTYEEWLETVRGPQGEPGADGVSITSAFINDSGEIIITYSDLSEQNLGRLVTHFQVTFYDYNGFFIDSVIVEYGDSVTPPSNPEREGYTFKSWSESLDNITCDLNVYATYDVNIYTVHFDSNGGTDFSDITNVEYGESIILQTPTREGYIFMGWFRGETINDAQFTSDDVVKGNITLYAKWVEESSNDTSELLTELGEEIVTNLLTEEDSINGVFAGIVFDEGEEDISNDDTVNVAYRIAVVQNDIYQQLSPWVSTSASIIVISTENITSQTITTGISVSMSMTVGFDVQLVSAETTWGFTASLEYAVTQTTANSITISFPLEQYDPTFNYAVFLTGGYEVYQVFSTNIYTGIVQEYFFVKALDTPSIRILSSDDAYANHNIDMEDYDIDDFDFDTFKISLEGEGTEESPYQIKSENDLYAMFYEPDKFYILMNDIEINHFDGLNGITFTGGLDGQGYSIRNFVITVDPHQMDEESNYGFFPILNGA